jgi:hypothetical protein
MLNKVMGIILLGIGASSQVFAYHRPPMRCPEINASSAASALALVAGTLILFCGRRRRSTPAA